MYGSFSGPEMKIKKFITCNPGMNSEKPFPEASLFDVRVVSSHTTSFFALRTITKGGTVMYLCGPAGVY